MKLFAPSAPRIFIASTSELSLLPYRAAASDIARNAGCLAIMHEDWTPEARRTLAECRKQVDSCHAVAVIVGGRYGYVVPQEDGGTGRHSITELEVQHAAAEGLPVFAFIVDPAPPLSDGEHESQAVRDALATFKTELKRGVVRTVPSVPEFKAALIGALSAFKSRLFLRNLRIAVIAATMITVSAVAWSQWRTSEPGPLVPEPKLLTHVHGTVTTRKRLPPGPAMVALACDPGFHAAVNSQGEYTISLEKAPDPCRSLPVKLSVSTVDGRRSSGLAADADNANLEVDDPPNRIVATKPIGFELHEVQLENPVLETKIGMFQEFRNDPTASPREPRVFVVHGDPGNRAGLLVTETAPEQDSIVTVTGSRQSMQTVIAELRQKMQAAGTAGLNSLEKILVALSGATTDRRVISEAYEQIAMGWKSEDCAARQQALKWLRLASTADPSRDLRMRDADLDARRTLACVKP